MFERDVADDSFFADISNRKSLVPCLGGGRFNVPKANGRRAAMMTGNQPPVRTSAEPPTSILVVDVGGTKIKVLVSGQSEPRKFTSGRRMTPVKMVETINKIAGDWDYDAVSIGIPGLVGRSGPKGEPGNLGSGWVGFDFAAAFERPVRISNDAAMQALGCYEGGRMLFLGLGTGLGSALICDKVLVTLELGDLPVGDGSKLSQLLGRQGLRELGKKRWRCALADYVPALASAFETDYVVLGGGLAKEVKQLPPGSRLGNNLASFRGGYRLWHLEEIETLDTSSALPVLASREGDWRII